MWQFPLTNVAPGTVRCVFAPQARTVPAAVQDALLRSEQDRRLITHWCDELPDLEPLLERLVASLAEAAHLLWPDWYDGSFHAGDCRTTGEQHLTDRLANRRIAETHRHINAGWLQAAVAACRAQRGPLLPQFPPAVQAKQLSLALAAEELIIVVGLTDPAPSAERLLGFARAMEWLAREAHAGVVAALPRELAGRPELDGITFGAAHWTAAESRVPSGSAEFEERKHLVCPIVGRPHPASPGEGQLARQLERDSQLRPLFGFNQPVTTIFENRFLVDLLWAQGRVVVEIDGYGHHATPAAFHSDRHRDYELILSGYLVLRLPHDFVVQDPRLAMERIRDVVEFRMRQPEIQESVQ